MATTRRMRTCTNGHILPPGDDNCPICIEVYNIWGSLLPPYQIRKLQELYRYATLRAGQDVRSHTDQNGQAASA